MLAALLLAAVASSSAQPPTGSGGPAMPPPAVSTPAYSGPALTVVPDEALPRFEESFKAKAGLIRAAKKAVKYLESLPPAKRIVLAGRDYAPAALIDSAKEIAAIAQTAKTAVSDAFGK